MEEELTYPRYDDAGNLIEGPRVIQPEEEEVLEEDGGILNATQTSQSSVAQTILFPQTMQMQREIFVLKGDYITPQDAENKPSVCLACALKNTCNAERLICFSSRS